MEDLIDTEPDTAAAPAPERSALDSLRRQLAACIKQMTATETVLSEMTEGQRAAIAAALA